MDYYSYSQGVAILGVLCIVILVLWFISHLSEKDRLKHERHSHNHTHFHAADNPVDRVEPKPEHKHETFSPARKKNTAPITTKPRSPKRKEK